MADLLTEAECAALEALLAQATPGKWVTVRMLEDADGLAVMAHYHHEGFVADCSYAPNATFIAAVHNALPALLATIRELRAENDALRTALAPLAAVGAGLDPTLADAVVLYRRHRPAVELVEVSAGDARAASRALGKEVPGA